MTEESVSPTMRRRLTRMSRRVFGRRGYGSIDIDISEAVIPSAPSIRAEQWQHPGFRSDSADFSEAKVDAEQAHLPSGRPAVLPSDRSPTGRLPSDRSPSSRTPSDRAPGRSVPNRNSSNARWGSAS